VSTPYCLTAPASDYFATAVCLYSRIPGFGFGFGHEPTYHRLSLVAYGGGGCTGANLSYVYILLVDTLCSAMDKIIEKNSHEVR
jgi:hypothetical protein